MHQEKHRFPESYDVIVLGGGASGLICAFTAAQRGRRVLVLEKANKVGKKILMSGGGRCNFTNLVVEAENFVSGNPHFSKSPLARYTQWDFIALVEQYGIAYEERRHGQLFCLGSAKEVLTMLLTECDKAGVEIRSRCVISRIEALQPTESSEQERGDKNGRYRLKVEQEQNRYSVEGHSLVVATGGLSIPTLGGSGQGYAIAEQFNLALTERRAGLVPFMFSDAMKGLCERLSGLAVEASLQCNGQSFTENILFTHRGISGPAALQISSYWYPGDELIIDLLPGEHACDWLLQLKRQNPKGLLKTQLSKKFAKPLVRELQALWWPDLENEPLANFPDKKLREIGDRINRWSVKPSATEGYRTAEVTLGGVDTQAVSSKTMEAKQQPGLFFIGEVLDVSGHLGGFNFQWAWSSGYTAGLFV